MAEAACAMPRAPHPDPIPSAGRVAVIVERAPVGFSDSVVSEAAAVVGAATFAASDLGPLSEPLRWRRLRAKRLVY